ncbi:hypothetical protein [Pseudomonas oryzihabitans]|uniref:Uncharacterized protein n=1 Tax=Pseudomonas oryzihabitans TaxID=47885 RepID=A0A1G5PHH9_9PSED|nr:hypothetical protein [Pseudomonas psychrotolerans]NMY92825.1 hypothetical protein [Pseudomonas psychrotolerans]SCZ48963.1 hypothetical protein SAMN05216279_1438 [Pseudomonas psychrotolerans]
MTITAQAPISSVSNWLTVGDLLGFARKIWPAVSGIEALERRVEALYGAACERFPTYDGMVHQAFCSSMNDEFGTDEHADGVAPAFEYAREAYGYMSPREVEKLRQENAAVGICCHGLDFDCCPRGCGDLD